MRSPVERLGFVALLLSVGVVAGCGSGKKAADPFSPPVYLDHALAVIHADALYAPALNWPAVTAKAHAMAAQATTASGTYAAIQYAIGALEGAGDLHAHFYIAPVWKQLVAETSAEAVPSPPPTASLVKGRLGWIVLPGVITTQTSANSRAYIRRALSRISSLQAKDRPCGWIVDLRNDTGGNMYPMLLSLGPILGEGNLIGFTGRKGFRYYVAYHHSALSGRGYTDRAPLTVEDITPAPPVAVLTSQMTASAGEVVTVAFHGRRQTRSFGSPTLGATNGPLPHRLADGAVLFFAVDYYVDRHGTVYRDPIKPDVSFAYNAPESVTERAAEKWLLSTAACSRRH